MEAIEEFEDRVEKQIRLILNRNARPQIPFASVLFFGITCGVLLSRMSGIIKKS